MKVTIEITGMHCDHCVRAVEGSLGGVPGVESCRVEVGLAEVTVDAAAVDKADLIAAIRDAGRFEIAGFTSSPVES